MARKPRGGRGGRGDRGRGAPRRSGIEAYGQDAADEFLALDESGDEAVEDEEGEEDVMQLTPLDDGSKVSRAKDKKSKKGLAEPDEDVDLAPVSKGWGRGDFYGGEDAGDDSEGASDEDLTFKEAKKLEELRAARLQSLSDPLSALLGQAFGEGEDQNSKAQDVDAEFEAVFAEQAEKSMVQRDLSQLSDAKRKSLLKKESPELLPLLQDFQDKINTLLPLLSLLKPSAKTRLPSSGASYLEARVSLLLNHLANLSFYLMIKAEGANVRSHPVVSQLVWLRELGELMKAVDERVGTKLKKAVKQAKKLPDVEESGDAETTEPPKVEVAQEVTQKQSLSLAERLARLRGKSTKNGSSEPKALGESAAPLVSSLLRLPPSRRKANRGSGEAPADLDEIDPTLGAWMPSVSLSQQLSEVQQHLRERKAKAAPQASDVNPEPRARAHRERVQTEIDPREAAESSQKEAPLQTRSGSGGDDDGLAEVQEANAKSRIRKEKKEAERSAKMQQKLAQQFHPEKKVEGRRASSKQILENRGLVRFRKKKAGNARVANRQKYDKLVKRRKGAVQEMREGAADGATYDGEATGLRTNLRKSMKLG